MSFTDSSSSSEPIQRDRYVVGFGGADASIREPSVAALRLLDKLITGACEDKAYSLHAQTDLRVVKLLDEELAANPANHDSIKWLRQLAISWSSRLRSEHARKFRRIFELIEAAHMVARSTHRQTAIAA